MKIPYEFEQFVRRIYPEDPRESESLESLAVAALEDSGSHDRRPLLAFLNELLDGGHSDAELEYVWLKQSPRSSFSVFAATVIPTALSFASSSGQTRLCSRSRTTPTCR